MPRRSLSTVFCLFIGVIIFSLVFCFVLNLKEEVLASGADNIAGWAWSENIGWFSMNNVNQGGPKIYGLNLDRANDLSGYAWVGLEHGGWLAFGKTVLDIHNVGNVGPIHGKPGGVAGDPLRLIPAPLNAAPDGGSVYAKVNLDNSITGWARFLNLWDYGHNVFNADDWGWVKLNDANYGLKLNPEKRRIEGYAWSGGGTVNEVNDPSTGYGWIHFANVGLKTIKLYGYVCKDGDGNQTCDAAEERQGDAVIFSDKGGHRTFSAKNPLGYYEFANIALPDTNNPASYNFTVTREGCAPKVFGVTLDPAFLSLQVDFPLVCGAAAAGDLTISGIVFDDLDNTQSYTAGDTLVAGALVYSDYGDTAFSDSSGKYTLYKLKSQLYTLDVSMPGYKLSQALPSKQATPTATVNFALKKTAEYKTTFAGGWVQTLQGDIHSAGKVKPKSGVPYGYANATYVISAAGSLDRVNSWSKDFASEAKVRGQDWVLGNYSSPQLERLHGDINLTSLKDSANFTVTGGNKTPDYFNNPGIYYKSGDLVLESGVFAKGARTIVVEGNVSVNGDLAYEKGEFSRTDLPVVGIVAGGDIKFKNEVRRVVGNYYSKGTISDLDRSVEPMNLRLINEGLMVAGKFSFERQITHEPTDSQYGVISIGAVQINNSYTDPEIASRTNVMHFDAPEFESPAVLIFYDGRVMINVPPGFESVAAKLPQIWEEVPAAK